MQNTYEYVIRYGVVTKIYLRKKVHCKVQNLEPIYSLCNIYSRIPATVAKVSKAYNITPTENTCTRLKTYYIIYLHTFIPALVTADLPGNPASLPGPGFQANCPTRALFMSVLCPKQELPNFVGGHARATIQWPACRLGVRFMATGCCLKIR